MFTNEQTSFFESALNFFEKFDSEWLQILFGDEKRFTRWLKKLGIDECVDSVSD